MFSILGNLAKAAVKTALLPVTVVADVATLGGTLTDQKQSYTGKMVEGISNNLNDIAED